MEEVEDVEEEEEGEGEAFLALFLSGNRVWLLRLGGNVEVVVVVVGGGGLGELR